MAKAYVLIVNESGNDDSVISNLRNIPSVTSAYGTYGSFDLLTTLESNNEEDIQNDICFKIRQISKIRSTVTLLVDKKLGISKINTNEQKVLDTNMDFAYMIIHCLQSDELIIIKKLDEIAEVIEADILIGNYEIICKIAAPTYKEISKIISKKIRKINEIKSTIIIFLTRKQEFTKNQISRHEYLTTS